MTQNKEEEKKLGLLSGIDYFCCCNSCTKQQSNLESVKLF